MDSGLGIVDFGLWFRSLGFRIVLGSIRDPLKGTLLNPTSGSLKRDLIERVYIPKGPPNPNSQTESLLWRICGLEGLQVHLLHWTVLLLSINTCQFLKTGLRKVPDMIPKLKTEY